MKYHFLLNSTVIFILFVLFNNTTATAQPINIIPQPVSIQTENGSFLWNRQTTIIYDGNEELKTSLEIFIKSIGNTGTISTVIPGEDKKNTVFIKLNATKNDAIGEEGYNLSVSESNIQLTANTEAGIFYGLQTLSQLFPPSASAKHPRTTSFQLPCVKITDYPRFGYRGLLLDVARHFFTKDELKKYIDQMAKYKYNILHLHLTDDQGWRIEIKSLPELTKKGAYSVSRTGKWWSFQRPKPGEEENYGGFYTQEDMKEIIQYAKARAINILPEIEMPAHSLALIASYPNLSCTQLHYDVNAGWKFTEDDNVLCVGNDTVFSVIDKILSEVATLFPYPYIHIGGDEANKAFWKNCPKCQKRMHSEGLKNEEELQSYFIKRIEKLLISKHRQLIGWDEILEGGLAPEATVMSWRGTKGGIEAAKMNHKVIMAPQDYCYLDLYQGDPVTEPTTYGMNRISNTYNFEPVSDQIDPKYILGGEGCLWTESVSNLRHAEYMTWPRALALAELWWSQKGKNDWNKFVPRMENHFERFDAANVKYARSVYDPYICVTKLSTADSLSVKIKTEIEGLDVYYSFDQSNPDNFYPKYNGKALIFPKGASDLKLVSYRQNKKIGQQITISKQELLNRANMKN